MKYLNLLLFILALLSGSARSQAQCTPCAATTISVDLSAKPDTVWTFTSTRAGSCCGITGGQACIRFNVTVHPQASQIGFNVANPAPPGGAFYQLNCGDQTSLGTPLCISGMTSFCISFCKNGGDSPNYTISSSKQFNVSPSITLSTGCVGQLSVAGMQTSSIQWTSIAPGAIGAYNSYLSCTSACASPTVTPGANPPAYVDFRVTGMVTGCATGTVSDVVRVNFVSGVVGSISPVAPAVCFGSATTMVTANGTGGVPPYSFVWKDGGGTVIGTSAAQALGVGSYTVTISDQVANCPGTVFPVNVIAHPSGITANAGPDQIRCTGSPTATLAGSVTVATGGTWTAAGGGTFSNPNSLASTFTPTAAQLSAGSATLTLTTTGNGGCTAATDQMVITYAANPVVSAGGNQTICSNGFAQLNGSVSGGASTGQWTSNGTGTFNPSNTALNATYTPSAADITAGTRTLTLTSTNGCTPVSNNMTLTIQPPPVVNAGSNASVCASSPAHVLNGSVTGGTTTGIWSTSGTGTFSSATAMNATYNPSAADISAGSVTLTLSSTNGCSVVTSSKTLQIRPLTVVNVGNNRTVCQGSTVPLTGTITGSTNTGVWTSTGNGTFSPSNTALNATYTPGSNEIASGSAIITLTSTGSISCPNTSASFNLTITPAPIVTASAPASICAGSTAQLTGSVTAGGNTGIWSGPGSFSPSATTLNAVFTPNASAVSAGTATVTLTSTNGCVVVSNQATITIQAQPVVNAGAEQTICEGSTASLSGSVTVGGSTGQWNTSGTGAFSSTTNLNTVYTPSSADITAGSVTITLTSTNGCAVVSDAMVLTITPAPVVNANVDQTICAGSTATLNGSVTVGGSTGSWSTSGTGTFSSASALNAVYTPSSADVSAGSVTLTLTSTNGCAVRTDAMVLTIAPLPIVAAGSNASVCASNAVHTLNGSVTGGASQGIWSTSGSGTFSNATALNATYTASSADITAGSVTLTLTSTNGCAPVSSSKTLQIRAVPVVTVGPDRTICEGSTVALTGTVTGSTTTGQWSTSGTGTFTPSATSLNATYTPSAADIAAVTRTITLTSTNSTPCSATSSSFVLTITPAPVVNAGASQTICFGTTAQLNGSVTVGGSTGTWSGNGTFSPNANALNAVFTPSASAMNAGSATLTLTSTNGCVVRTHQTMITITPLPVVNAGPDATVCTGSNAQLNGSVTVGGSQGIWSTSGSGSFSPNNTTLGATYVPSSNDISAGSVVLTLTSTNGCSNISDAMNLTITPAPLVNAGADQNICQGTTATLDGSVNVGGSTGSWSTSGSGTFSSATSLNAVYTPSTADVNAGSVTLTLTSTNGCVVRNDAMVLTISPLPVVAAGNNASVCASNAVHTLNGSVTVGSTTGTWTTSGTGSFTNPNALNATYTASAADISAGSVTLTLTATNACSPVSSSKVLQIRAVPVVTVGNDRTVCEGSTVALTGTVTGSTTTGIWSTSGTGTFSPSATSLNATYTPSAADITAGIRTITLTSTNSTPCSATSASFVLTITPAPLVNAGASQTICYGTNAQLNGSVTVGGSTGVWSGPGTFSPSTNSLNAVFTPNSAAQNAGTATLTLTSTNGCVVRTHQTTITITPLPVVVAGNGITVCAGSNATLNGTVTAGGSAGIWSTSGSGTFSSNIALNATYTPSTADISAGSVILTLTSTNGCSNLSDQLTLTITPAPVVNAGSDQTICQATTASLSGSVTVGGSTGTWSTSGTGTFSPSASALNATYTHSAADVSAGSVTLTLTSTNGCTVRNDAMVLTITPLPVVNANGNATVCASNAVHTLNGTVTVGGSAGIWSTSGTGSFSNSNALNATYTASPADITAGSVTLTLTSTDGCGVVSNSKILTIQPQPTANAGSNATRCANNATVALAGAISNGNNAGIWSTSGNGSFSPNATTLNATYTASANDIANGPVTLTLTTTSNGVCGSHADAMVLNFTPAPIVNANVDQTICMNNPVAQLNGSVTAGATTGIWSTSGNGTFSAANALNAIYTASQNDITSGGVILTLTSTDHGNCVAVTDQMTISFSGAPVVNAGPNVSVCLNNPATSLNGSVTVGATTGTWTTAGDGSFENANALNTTYNPGPNDLSNGSVLVTLTSTNFGNCIAVSDDKLISFGTGPLVAAGPDQTMCANNVVQLNGSVTGSTTTGVWSTSGNGSFQPSNTAFDAVYQPSAADTTSGSVTLTLTSTNNGTCNVESDAMTVTFTPAPIVSSGSDQTLCANNPVTALNGSVMAGTTTGIWTSTGTGNFSPSATALNATYTASATDISNGPITLTLTSTNHGNCVTVTDAMTISFTGAPLVNAGPNAGVCINNPSVALNGTVTGGATTGTWTTNGDGTFVNANALNTTYNPGTNDLSSGSVLLTLTATNFGNCTVVSDDKLITFGNGPVVDAGADQIVCANSVVQLTGSVSGSTTTGVWSTSGSGAFLPSENDLGVVYHPSAADTTSGSVTLTLTSTNNGTCNVVSDAMTVTFTPAPIVIAGDDQVICVNNPNAPLNGSVTAGATTGMWSTNGSGEFTPSASDLNATYTASADDIASGGITLTLTSTNFGNCVAVSDAMAISFSGAPVVNAGNDASVCINNPAVSLNGNVSVGATTGTWTTAGDGSFLNANALNTTYNPGPNDLANGSVLVTLTATNFGNCIVVSDDKLISFGNGPVVLAGDDQTMCANNVVQLDGSVTGSTSTGIWSTSGSGSFLPANTIFDAVYHPSAADTTNGSVTLTLTSTNNGTCNVETDAMVVNFTPAPIVAAGADQIVCANNATAVLNGSVSAGAVTGSWSTSGTGTFSPSEADLNASYTASAEDIASGNVVLTLTSTDHGNCVPVSDALQLGFSPAPVVFAGNNASVCINNPAANLVGSVTGGATTGTWTSSGDGSFVNANALMTTYHPGPNDLANGSVIVTLTSTNFGDCIAVSDDKLITFGNGPVVVAGADQTVCANNVVQLSGSVTGSTNTGMWSTSGSGDFLPSNTAFDAIYHPSVADTTAGSVVLTLISTNNGSCNVEEDEMVVTFTPAPLVNAGVDLVICVNDPVAQLNGGVSAGASTGVWSSNGSGTFSPSAAALNATYTASADDIASGGVILTLTSTNNGTCFAESDLMAINFSGSPVVNAGNDVSVCLNNPAVNLNGSVTVGATTGIWTTAGDGSFVSANALSTIYNPGPNDLANGSVLVTLTSTNNGNCISVSDDKLISFGNGPVVLAGDDQIMCANNVVALNGSVSGSTNTGAWSTSGSGFFLPSDSVLNAVYHPSAADTTAGSVIITLVSTNNGGCNVESDETTVSFTPAPIVVAGDDLTMCANNAVASLVGSVSAGASTGVWSTNGTGSFSPSTASLSATYTPSAEDLVNGVMITLTSTDHGNCIAVSNALSITYIGEPVVNAGGSQFVCLGENVQLNGAVINGAGTGIWTSNGTGSFSPSATALNATYVPSNDDYNAGVELTLTSTNNGNCTAESDVIQVSFTQPPFVFVGADQSTCDNVLVALGGNVSGSTTTGIWSTTGDGTFVPSATAVNASYQPGPTDAATGDITLTLQATNACPMQDQMVVTVIAGPSAYAGADQYICTGTTSVDLTGQVGGTATMGEWTSLGDGSFTPSANDLNAAYELGANELGLGGAILILTTLDNGVCAASSDTMLVLINGVPVLDAGQDTTICASEVLVLAGSSSNNGNILWTSSGDGSFIPDASTPDAEYHLGADDINNGSVTLTLSAPDACVPVAEQFELSIIAMPIVDPGMDQVVCAGVPVEVIGTIASETGTGIWSTLGTGTFLTDADQLTATYQPSADDIAAGTVNLMLTSTGDINCAPISSIMTISFNGDFSAEAGDDQLVCNSDQVQLEATVQGSASITWSTLGEGTFLSQTEAQTSYTATAEELAAGMATMILTAEDGNGCGTITDTLVVSFSATAMVDAGSSISICAGLASFELEGAVTGTSTTGIWSTSGDGQFIPDATDLNAIYELGVADQENGAQLTLTTTNDGPCGATSDNMDITIADGITVDAGNDATACLDTPGISLSGIVAGATETGEWSTAGDGGFNADAEAINAVYLPGTDDIANGSVWVYLTSTDNSGCEGAMDSLMISFLPMPEVLAGEDLTICAGDIIELNGWSSEGTTVNWSTIGAGAFADENSTITSYQSDAADGGSTLAIVLQATNGCGIVMDTLFAEVLAAPDLNIGYFAECGSTSVVFTNNSVGVATMEWNFGDGTTSENVAPVHVYPGIGTYQVTLTATNGICDASQTISVVVPEIPVAYFSISSEEVELNEDVVFESTSVGATQWSWSMGDGTIDVTGEVAEHAYIASGIYEIQLVVINDAGCTDSTTVSITVLEPDPIVVLPTGIPTAFTPNGDGVNDNFLVRGGPFAEFDFRIYDNWGVQIFNSEQQNVGWDGSYKGKDQPGGVYIYTFKGVTIDGTIVDMAGDITIIR